MARRLNGFYVAAYLLGFDDFAFTISLEFCRRFLAIAGSNLILGNAALLVPSFGTFRQSLNGFSVTGHSHDFDNFGSIVEPDCCRRFLAQAQAHLVPTAGAFLGAVVDAAQPSHLRNSHLFSCCLRRETPIDSGLKLLQIGLFGGSEPTHHTFVLLPAPFLLLHPGTRRAQHLLLLMCAH